MERFQSETLDKTNRNLPMLASSCPGWVCYAEKTHGSFILPYISTTRSAQVKLRKPSVNETAKTNDRNIHQQIMGMLVKEFLSKKLGVGSNRMYHVTVMPCYDKKLEASREDFYSEVNNSKDVDCVITSSKYTAPRHNLCPIENSLPSSLQSKLNRCWTCTS